MTDNNRVVIEATIGRLKEIRQAYIDHYLSFEGQVSEERLNNILDGIHQLEERIIELREQLPSPMSQRQLRAIEEIPEVWAEVTSKKPTKEAIEKALQEYADIAAGRIFIDDDNVAHVNGTIETPRMVIEAAPRRTGRTFRSWLCNYFK